jgi:hypothetical protein
MEYRSAGVMGLRMLSASTSPDGGALHSACRAETCPAPKTERNDFKHAIAETPRKPCHAPLTLHLLQPQTFKGAAAKARIGRSTLRVVHLVGGLIERNAAPPLRLWCGTIVGRNRRP